MTLHRVLLPLLLVTGLAVALAPTAEAAPHGGGAIHVGIGFGAGVPVGPAPVVHRVPVRPAGRFVWQIERVWVPAEVLRYDRFGHAIVREGYWAEQRVRVWVPFRRGGVRRGHFRRGHFGRGPVGRGPVGRGVPGRF